ncbi:uncharacterized protein LOC141656303 [Silene latifolia]|uniref:uncharacterized protein LOC141656303 n=1 Tax=Silene latifolia TaxID=37657 RepID=UPI003D77ED14
METGVPPAHRYATRCKLGRHNSSSSLSQEKPRVNDKAKDRVFARCKRKQRKRHTRVMDLPREVIFNILLLLPAKLLHEVVRYVCKQWYDIVSEPFFIRRHCQMPTTTTSASFIIQSFLEKRKKFERRNKVYCFDKDVTKIELPFPAMIKGSSNGLVLAFDNRDSQKVYLANPLRKRIIRLPSVLVPVVRSALSSTSSYSFAVNSSGQYKMVHFYACEYQTSYDVSVFTIGIDKAWRRIPLQTGLLEICEPLFIAGIMYWCRSIFPFLAMDIDTETLYLISYSNNVDRSVFDWDLYNIYFISMGSALGIMVEDYSNPDIWKLLKLTDVKSSEWTEIGMIDIGAIVSKVSNGKWTTYEDVAIKPVSLIHGELCFYCGVSTWSSWLIRYNLANQSFVSFVVKMSYRTASVFPHVPTLVSPKNCIY